MTSAAVATRPQRVTLYTLFTANAISMIGNQLTTLAIPWFVLATTGSATKTGITAFFSILPVVLAAFFGGALVDRVGYKRMSILADLASGVTVMLVPLLYLANMLPFWALLALVFLGALFDAPGSTAREALVPDIANAAQMSLDRASSLIQVVSRGSLLIGAPLGGVLIAALGPQNVLWIDAATFGVSALLIWLVVPNIRHTATASGSYLAEMRDGLRFIGRDRLILALGLVIIITNFLDAAKSSVVLPVFARDAYGSVVALGLMFALSGGGAVAGALLYSAIGHHFSRRQIFIWGFIFAGAPTLLLALTPPLPVVLIAQTIIGFASGPINPILGAIQYERVPAHMRGRVIGAITAGAYMTMPLGVLVAGYVLEQIGVQTILLVIGVCYIIATGSLIFNPVLHEMDGRPNNETAN